MSRLLSQLSQLVFVVWMMPLQPLAEKALLPTKLIDADAGLVALVDDEDDIDAVVGEARDLRASTAALLRPLVG